MSTTIEQSSVSPWRPIEDLNIGIKELKKPRTCYIRLESESSKASEDETESIYSLQGKDTDVIRDTTDTESQTSDMSGDEYELEFEYEVASLSENDDVEVSTTDSEGMMLAAAAAVMCDSSLEAWVTITDVEDSETSSEETSFDRKDFSTCVQCKGENRNSLYRFCEKCFQDRKKFNPPRPRRNRRKPQIQSDKRDSVKLDTLRNCLSGLSSQVSGSETVQECPSLGLDKIIVPKHLQSPGTSTSLVSNSVVSETALLKNSSKEVKTSFLNSKRKRQSSESSLSDYEVKKPKLLPKSEYPTSDFSSEAGSSSSALSGFSSETSGFHSEKSLEKCASFDSDKSTTELCIFCNAAPKDGIFLHTNLAHRCCCYPCAKKTLKAAKRCPICNRSVNKVVRIFTC